MMKIEARAKLNLTLDVLSQREDGYHNMRMVMQSVTLSDEIEMRPGPDGIQVRTNLRYLPNDDRNLAVIAIHRFCEAAEVSLPQVELYIQKHIPVCAGMAGGSSDAAAVLRLMNEYTERGYTMKELEEIGARVGSDVPYCVQGGTALAEGRGEVLTALPPLPHCFVVICKPPFPISTPELFSALDCQKIRHRPDTAGVLSALKAADLGGVARRLFNVFEDVLPARSRGAVEEIKAALLDGGALGAVMTGTGPTVFGLFDRQDLAKATVKELRRTYQDTFLSETV